MGCHEWVLDLPERSMAIQNEPLEILVMTLLEGEVTEKFDMFFMEDNGLSEVEYRELKEILNDLLEYSGIRGYIDDRPPEVVVDCSVRGKGMLITVYG